MKTLRTLFAITAVAVCTAANAQDNGLNAVYKVAVADLGYTAPESTATQENKPKIGKLIGKSE